MSGIAEWQSDGGALQLGHCNRCGEPHYYPRRVCPFCFSDDIGRVEASGRGRVYSHSYSPRGPNGPYILAYVTLDEGVTMLTNLIDVEPSAVTIDMQVAVEFRMIGEAPVPMFRPA